MTASPITPRQDTFHFGPFCLDLRSGRLLYGRTAVPLRPKTWAVLCYLISRSGTLISKDELLGAVWADTVVSEETLTKSIREIRHALGDDAKSPTFLETVHGRGYRFVATAPTGVNGDPPRVAHDVDDAVVGDAVPTAGDAVVHHAEQAHARAVVGRAVELSTLSTHLQRAAKGTRQIVFISGELGVGKTAVVEAFLGATHLVPAGTLITRGYSVEQHGEREPYLPVLDALDHLIRQPGAAHVLGLLRHVAPSWLTNLPWLAGDQVQKDVPPPSLNARPQRMLREFAAFVEALTADVPVVMALEDLHWCDPSTVDLLFMLAQRSEPARLLIIGTYRPAELAVRDHSLLHVRHTLQARRQCADMALNGFTIDAVQTYLDLRCPGGEWRALARLIHAMTDGTPLFVDAVVDQLIGRGWLVDTNPGWALSVPLSAIQPSVPDNLRQIICTDLHAMHPDEQHLLEAASVAGTECPAQAVAAGIESPLDEAEGACERLARAHRFLRVVDTQTWPDGSIARRYAFRHALHRQIVYDQVPDARRRILHQRIGEALEAAHAPHIAPIAGELAHHFERSGDRSRALEYLATAASGAQARCAPREAIAYLDAALALTTQLPSAPERRRRELALRLQLGPSLNAIHGFASDVVRDNYERARVLCRGDADPRILFGTLYALWYSHGSRAERAETRGIAEELVDVSRRIGDPELVRVANVVLGRTALYEGKYAEACGLLQPPPSESQTGSVSAAEPFGPEIAVLERSHLAIALWFLGYPDRALATMRESLAIAEETESPFTLAAAFFHCAYVHHLRREHEEACEFAERLMHLAAEHDFAYFRGLGSALSGWALAQRGEGKRATDQIREAIDTYRATGARFLCSHLLALLAEGYRETRQIDEGLAAAEEGLTLAATMLDAVYEPELWRLKGELLSDKQRRPIEARTRRRVPSRSSGQDAAEVALQRALDMARARSAKSLELRAAVSLAHLWHARGDAAQARVLVAKTYDWFTEGFETADLQAAKRLLAFA